MSDLKQIDQSKIKRQKTQVVTKSKLLAAMDTLKGFSRLDSVAYQNDQLENLRKNVTRSTSKIIQYALNSPIVQKHERTPSFINKLPTELKQMISENGNDNVSKVSYSKNR